ncbi:hypothetical protein [Streptomyces sp. NPDC050982]|uniref:hypothetical protein n=1 Tax=Streptomyces sp. NPDC050982 TaxID=3154746 RepID=UPI00340BAF51
MSDSTYAIHWDDHLDHQLTNATPWFRASSRPTSPAQDSNLRPTSRSSTNSADASCAAQRRQRRNVPATTHYGSPTRRSQGAIGPLPFPSFVRSRSASASTAIPEPHDEFDQLPRSTRSNTRLIPQCLGRRWSLARFPVLGVDHLGLGHQGVAYLSRVSSRRMAIASSQLSSRLYRPIDRPVQQKSTDSSSTTGGHTATNTGFHARVGAATMFAANETAIPSRKADHIAPRAQRRRSAVGFSRPIVARRDGRTRTTATRTR